MEQKWSKNGAKMEQKWSNLKKVDSNDYQANIQMIHERRSKQIE